YMWKQSKLVKWTSSFLILLVIGLTVFMGQLLIVRAARLKNGTCSLVTAGSGDTNLQLDPSLNNDAAAKSLVDSNKYNLQCNASPSNPSTSNNYLIGLGTPNTCTSLASTGTNNSSIHSGESDGSDVSLIIPVNPCYSPPPQGPNGSQPVPLALVASESQPMLVGSLTKDHLDHYCQQKLNARSAVAQRVGQTAYSWQCHQTLNDGTQMPSMVMSEVCQEEFHRSDVQDRLLYFWNTHPDSSFDPNSAWQCVARAKKLGNVTFDQINAYCRNLGYATSEVAVTDTPSAYDYRCIRQNSQISDKLDTFIGVCQSQYKQYKYVIDRLANYHAPLSWECWTGA
ncbi:MAG TPA: hypothetical protein VHV10_10360, partial [Ktedonobacteraceae bacterium]|nr:hypothetical protein [Ktedonobacteraceae bacterium]